MIIDPGSTGFSKSNSATSGGNKLNKTDAAPETNFTAGDKASAASTDSVSLSTRARTLGKLEQAVAQSADVDTAKVDRVKQAIANGQYQINSSNIAGRMLSEDSLL